MSDPDEEENQENRADLERAIDVMALCFYWGIILEKWMDPETETCRIPQPFGDIWKAAPQNLDPGDDWKVYKYTIMERFGNTSSHF